jgi:regulator of RNase E activity RraA
MSQTLLSRLARLDTCAVSDALDAQGLSGVALELKALTVRKRIVGEAVTVQLGINDNREAGRHLCTAAVEASGPGKILVIAHNARTDVAGWGGLLSLSASLRGAEGVVIDGACRDIDEAIDLHLPIYGKGGVPVTARSRIVEYAWDVPVTISGARVAPSDLVIADASGVVFIARDAAEEVIARAEALFERERLMTEQVRKGEPISRVMGKSYETLLESE